ncbi:MFS transporter [Providencia manganoxydans]|uniref:MFS transporter n=1 Tax=Providencia manganoxydans TaxID=2923283 RepID=UPI0032D9C499
MQWSVRFKAAIGNALEYYDVAIFAAVSIYLSEEFKQLGYANATEMIWSIFALRLVIRPLGGYVIGRYADRVGKKSALVLTSIISGGATLGMALLPIQFLGVYTPIVVLLLQVTLSFSYAGQFPSLVIYLFNSSKSNERSRISAMLVCFAIFGVIYSFFFVFILEHFLKTEDMQSFGWRIPFILGVINVFIIFLLRVKLPNLITKNNSDSGKCFSFFIFLITIPGSVIFYVQNISFLLILEQFNFEGNKVLYAMLSSIILFLFIAFLGVLTDKYSSAITVFNLGVYAMIFLSIPLYSIFNSNVTEWFILAQIIMVIYNAMILCNFSSVLATYSKGSVAILALGYSMGSAILGGVTPLIISYLMKVGYIYIGVFLTFCGLSFLLANKIYNSKNYNIIDTR